jgi:hypothetical protein
MRACLAPPHVAAGLLAALVLSTAAPIAAQTSHSALSDALRDLARSNPGRTELVTIATSPGGRAVQALRVGAAGRPSLLVVAGAHGPHLIGTEVAVEAARRLLAGPDSATVWFIPRLNPDAAEANLAALTAGRTANDAVWDDDRDGTDDEDPADDLNGDGTITRMRLHDPNGAWIADSAEPRLLRRADEAKGEVGMYAIETEGRDDDADERYNEDGPGGIDVNRNLSYDYPAHGREAGLHPFSAPEARGLAEFAFAHDDIAAVYVLGPQDNLMTPWVNRPNQGIMRENGTRAQEGTSAGGPLNSIMRADQATFADLSRRFKATTGLEKGPSGEGLAGDVLSWAYYHFGRWAAGSRGWWVPEAPKDTTKGAARGGGSGGGTDPLADDRNALKWFDARGIEAYAPWTAVTLGSAERRAAEVGGWRPGVLINPPAGAEHDSTLARQGRFIAEYAAMLPRLALRNADAERVGDGVYRIEVEVANTGVLPTQTAVAARLREPRRIRLDLALGDATLLSGEAVQLLGAIDGGGRSATVTWTVAARAGSTVTITAGSPVTGSATQTITLR